MYFCAPTSGVRFSALGMHDHPQPTPTGPGPHHDRTCSGLSVPDLPRPHSPPRPAIRANHSRRLCREDRHVRQRARLGQGVTACALRRTDRVKSFIESTALLFPSTAGSSSNMCRSTPKFWSSAAGYSPLQLHLAGEIDFRCSPRPCPTAGDPWTCGPCVAIP